MDGAAEKDDEDVVEEEDADSPAAVRDARRPSPPARGSEATDIGGAAEEDKEDAVEEDADSPEEGTEEAEAEVAEEEDVEAM